MKSLVLQRLIKMQESTDEMLEVFIREQFGYDKNRFDVEIEDFSESTLHAYNEKRIADEAAHAAWEAIRNIERE